MKVFIVLHQDIDGLVNVLGVYEKEDKANLRVGWERGMTDDVIWYTESELRK